MDNKTVTFSVRPSQGESGRVFLMILEQAPDEFGINKTKTGFLDVQADKAENIQKLFEDGVLKYRFGSLIPRTQNQYNVTYFKATEAPAEAAEGVTSVNTAVEHS